MRSPRFHPWFPRLFAVLLVLALLPWLGVAALAGQDSTAVVTDHTGIFGNMIDHYFGAIIGLIQSGGLWLATKASPRWKAAPEFIKWGVLYLVGVGLTFVSLKTGFGSAPIEGNALTLAAVLGAVPTLASGLIFKLGGHKVPEPPVATARRI